VEIKDFAYRDGTLEIAVGTTVEWVQLDTVPYTVTSFPGGDVFQSGKMSKGDEFSYTFTEPGTYEYFCEYHDNMKGTVIVR
jgi:plastocyanin